MPVAQQTAVTSKPSSEAHLRLILESQPVCLTRVGVPDGTFLAVNDAALSMLGAERLDQVLGTRLFDLIDEGQRGACREFLVRVAAGERGSIETDFTALSGTRHRVQIHAVPHPQPVDGLASALCTFRDITEYRRLEAAVVENASRGPDESSLHRLQELEATVAEHQAAREQAEATAAAHQAAIADLERRLEEAEARAAELAGQTASQAASAMEVEELRAKVEALNRELSEQTALRTELEATIAGHEARTTELEQLLAESEARVRELNEAVNATRELEQMLLDQQAQLAMAQEERSAAEARARELAERYQTERADWQRRLDDALDARARDEQALKSALSELERRRSQLARVAELARDIIGSAPDLGSLEPISVGMIARAMEPVLVSLVGSEVEFVMVAASSEPVPDITREALEEILLSLVAGRRAAMTAGGQITIEVADVTIDDACAKERRGFRPGPYVLLGLHASGHGVASGLPAGIFGMPPEAQLWKAAGPGMASVYATVMNAGGYLWIAHEGRDAIAFELYFPRVQSPDAPAPLFA
ncbi:MAG TPA: PAS domain-containing protein [Vicinamibacterales bacterium]|nr:PAS domain-containing protein [Vicinamibacterales bacterium]